MSTKQVQISNILEEVSKSYFAAGINPQLSDILKHVSEFFSKYPAGQPFPIPDEYVAVDAPTSLEALNQTLAHAIANVDVLYETSALQLEEIMLLTTALRTHLDRLKTKRKVLETRIDDYLLGVYNTEGYFYSISDSFADLTLTDTSLTTCFVDTVAGTLSIPALSNLSKTIPLDRLGTPNIKIVDSDGAVMAYVQKSGFDQAVDGLTNTAWFLEVASNTPKTLIATVSIPLATRLQDIYASRVEYTPYGVTPVKAYVEVYKSGNTGNSSFSSFSNSIQNSADKMVFVADDSEASVSEIKFTFIKDAHDYTMPSGSNTNYIYIFGAKELAISEYVYDLQGTFVSAPLGLPSEMLNDAAIDAVSIVTDEVVPPNTSVRFYVAPEASDPTSIANFDWKEITPLSKGIENGAVNTVVNFQGVLKYTRNIKRTPGSTDLQLIDFDASNADLTKRNPSPAIVSGEDIYRIAKFEDDYLVSSLQLEEGLNTVRIYHKSLSTTAITQGLSYWKDIVNNTTESTKQFASIDSGNNFFYGGDIGESNRSVYMETYIEIADDMPLFFKEFQKSDSNSSLWDIKVYLNGREVAYLPAGINEIVIPWKFQVGRNHIALIINIPKATALFPSPYIGTVELMRGTQLGSLGIVRLGTLDYVDFFHFQYNYDNKASIFTIHNGEILTKKRSTTNYRISYSKQSSNSPSTIRLRTDLTRSNNAPHASPLVHSYRLRFAYR